MMAGMGICCSMRGHCIAGGHDAHTAMLLGGRTLALLSTSDPNRLIVEPHRGTR